MRWNQPEGKALCRLLWDHLVDSLLAIVASVADGSVDGDEFVTLLLERKAKGREQMPLDDDPDIRQGQLDSIADNEVVVDAVVQIIRRMTKYRKEGHCG